MGTQEKQLPFRVGQRVRYVGGAIVQLHDGSKLGIHGSTGTVEKVIKSRKVARVLIDDSDGPRWCRTFDANWTNLVDIAKAGGGA